VLRTNTDYNAETVAHVYKALWTVEDIFRATKSILETRPIYHRCSVVLRHYSRSKPLSRTNAFFCVVSLPVRLPRLCELPESAHPQRCASWPN
jgi:hypothetical protein